LRGVLYTKGDTPSSDDRLLPGTLTANLDIRFTAHANMSLLHVSSVASNDPDATLKIGISSNDEYLAETANVVGATANVTKFFTSSRLSNDIVCSSFAALRTAKLNGFIVEPFTFLLQDILYHAYQRSVEVGRSRKLATNDYSKLFSVSAPDISRSDNEVLARSARDITQGLQSLATQLPGHSETFTKQLLRIAFKFSGEPQTEDVIERIYQEAIIEKIERSSELPSELQ